MEQGTVMAVSGLVGTITGNKCETQCNLYLISTVHTS